MDAKELYEMKLHDIGYSHNYEIIRVPGGWIYTPRFEEDGQCVGTFVPMNSEFRRQEPKA